MFQRAAIPATPAIKSSDLSDKHRGGSPGIQRFSDGQTAVIASAKRKWGDLKFLRVVCDMRSPISHRHIAIGSFPWCTTVHKCGIADGPDPTMGSTIFDKISGPQFFGGIGPYVLSGFRNRQRLLGAHLCAMR